MAWEDSPMTYIIAEVLRRIGARMEKQELGQLAVKWS